MILISRMVKWFAILFFMFQQEIYAQTLEKAVQLFEMQSYDKAKGGFLLISKRSADYSEANYYLGRIAFNEKDYEKASEYFEVAIESKKNIAKYYEWYGDALGNILLRANIFRQGFLAPKMRGAWEKAVSLDAKTVGSRKSLIDYYLQAPSFMGGSIKNAEKMARDLLSLSPLDGHEGLGKIYDYQGKIEEAEREYLESLKISSEAFVTLGNFYIDHQKYSEAFKLFTTNKSSAEGGCIICDYYIGKIGALSGKWLSEGEIALKKYIQHNPSAAEPTLSNANLRLGQIYEKKGNRELAKISYQQSLRLNKSSKEAKEGLNRLSY
jgi:tetratricopeptide (TPR) repeat protein